MLIVCDSILTGGDDNQRRNRKPGDMIINGPAKPSQFVGHRLPPNRATVAFETFNGRVEGTLKNWTDWFPCRGQASVLNRVRLYRTQDNSTRVDRSRKEPNYVHIQISRLGLVHQRLRNLM